MTDRVLCVNEGEISLYFAKQTDKILVYNMGREEIEIQNAMFFDDCVESTWEEYKDQEDEFYSGIKSKNSYLLIEYENEIIGTVSHSYNQAKVENMEIDIWFRSIKNTGKGLGTKTLLILTDYLNMEYGIKTFIIRPGKKNLRAIRAYEKSGFVTMPTFDSSVYYGDDVGEWGDGDYGIEGTLNMIKVYIK